MIADAVHHHYPHVSYATAYCLRGKMRDGSQVRAHSIAHNYLRPGTRIRLSHAAFGLRTFVVRDTGPALRDGHFDIWVSSCSAASKFKRPIRYRITS